MNKWKTSSPPVAPSKGRRKKDIIEPSPNSRATCQKCEKKIVKGDTRIGIQGKIETPQGIQVYRLHYYHDNCITEETKRKLHTAPSGSKQPPKKKAKKDTNCNTSTSNAKKPAAKQTTSTNPTPPTTRQLKPKVRKQLEHDLRQLRSCYASQQSNCEEYKIFSNKSLTELLTKLPTNNAELSECWGIKGKRIKQYGKSILTIINSYLDKQQEQEGRGNGRRMTQTTIPMSPPSTSRRGTSYTVNNNSSSASAVSASAAVSSSSTVAAAVVTPAKPSATTIKKEEDTDDEEIVIGPTISIEEIVRGSVQEAEARGEVLEIL